MTFSALGILPLAASDWVAPVFGVLGVVIGGGITTAGTVLVQREAAKREQEANAAARDTTVATVMSILRGSLAEIGSFLRALTANQTWLPFDEEWVAVWQDQRRVLAGLVDGQTYETVSAAYLVARRLRWQSSSQGQPLSPTDYKLIGAWLERVEEGLKALDEFATGTGASSPQTRQHEGEAGDPGEAVVDLGQL